MEPYTNESTSVTYALDMANIINVGHTRKLEAIKMLREGTGLGLKQAKDVIELLIGQTTPISADNYSAYQNLVTRGSIQTAEDNNRLREQNNEFATTITEMRREFDDCARANRELHSKQNFYVRTLREALAIVEPRLVRYPYDYGED